MTYPLYLTITEVAGEKYFVTTGLNDFYEKGDEVTIVLNNGKEKITSFERYYAVIENENEMKSWYIEGEIVDRSMNNAVEINVSLSDIPKKENSSPLYATVKFDGSNKEYIFKVDIKDLQKGDLVEVESAGRDSVAAFERYLVGSYGARKNIVKKIEMDRKYYEGYSSRIHFEYDIDSIMETVFENTQEQTKIKVIDSLLEKNDYETIALLQEEEKLDPMAFAKFRAKEIQGEVV